MSRNYPTSGIPTENRNSYCAPCSCHAIEVSRENGMRYGQMLLGAIALLIASHASAGLKEVQYAEIPGWVVPVPKPTDSPTPDGAPLRIAYLDYQIHLGPD